MNYFSNYDAIGGTTASGINSITLNNGTMPIITTITGITQANTEVSISGNVSNNKTHDINPKLYFKFVKSKLKPMELKALKSRLNTLKKLVASTKEMGQQAAFEELSRLLSVVVRESEAVSCGVTTWIKKEDIEKFKEKVKDKVIKFTKLEDFPRPIPKIPREKIKGIRLKGLFDEYWILYVDYTKEVVKTNKEKIREKDPVVFGKYNFEPDKFYFITEWVDKYCDLTIGKVVDTIKLTDSDYELGEIPDIDEDLIEAIKKEVAARVDRLNNAKPSNFRNLMEEEDKKPPKIKESLLSKIKRFWST